MKNKYFSLLLFGGILCLLAPNALAAQHDCVKTNASLPDDKYHQGIIDLAKIAPSAQKSSYKLEEFRYLHDKLGWVVVIPGDEEPSDSKSKP